MLTSNVLLPLRGTLPSVRTETLEESPLLPQDCSSEDIGQSSLESHRLQSPSKMTHIARKPEVSISFAFQAAKFKQTVPTQELAIPPGPHILAAFPGML